MGDTDLKVPRGFWVDRNGTVRPHTGPSEEAKARRRAKRRTTSRLYETEEVWVSDAKAVLARNFKPGDMVSSGAMAKFLGCSRVQAWRILGWLTSYGSIEPMGKGRGRLGAFRVPETPE